MYNLFSSWIASFRVAATFYEPCKMFHDIPPWISGGDFLQSETD